MGRPITRSADQILEAAEALFAEEGYGPASLRQVMAAAEVSPTAFYARFDSKQAVLEALVDRFLAELQQRAEAALATAPDLERGFELGAAVLAGALLERPVIARLALTEASAVPALRDRLGTAYTLLATLISTRLAKLSARRVIGAIDTKATGWAIVGALQLQVARWAVFAQLDDAELEPALRAAARALLPAAGARRKNRRR